MESTKTKLTEVFKNTGLEGFEFEGFETAEELIENLNTQIDETEVIYYSNAIEYLAENDASLNESLSLANDMGYTCEKLNSEILATLLQQNNLREELAKLETDIKEAFEEND